MMRFNLERVIGSVMGMFVGDALGSQNEFRPVLQPANAVKKFNTHKNTKKTLAMSGHSSFPSYPGQWTDDASMGISLFEALAEAKAKGVDIVKDFPHAAVMSAFIRWWYQNLNTGRDRAVGLGGIIGGSIRAVLEKSKVTNPDRISQGDLLNSLINIPKTVQTFCQGKELIDGNGSIMRNVVAPLAESEEEAMRLAWAQSSLTTSGVESGLCAMLQAYLSFQAMQSNEAPQAIKDRILSHDNLQNFLTLAKNILGGANKIPDTILSLCGSTSCNKELEGKNYSYHQLNWRVALDDYQLNPYTSKTNSGYYGAYATDGMALALHVLHNTDSFADALSLMTLYQGDSDSTGAILGIMAGAIYGINAIPKEWRNAVNRHSLNHSTEKGAFFSPELFIRGILRRLYKVQQEDLPGKPLVYIHVCIKDYCKYLRKHQIKSEYFLPEPSLLVNLIVWLNQDENLSIRQKPEMQIVLDEIIERHDDPQVREVIGVLISFLKDPTNDNATNLIFQANQLKSNPAYLRLGIALSALAIALLAVGVGAAFFVASPLVGGAALVTLSAVAGGSAVGSAFSFFKKDEMKRDVIALADTLQASSSIKDT